MCGTHPAACTANTRLGVQKQGWILSRGLDSGLIPRTAASTFPQGIVSGDENGRWVRAGRSRGPFSSLDGVRELGRPGGDGKTGGSLQDEGRMDGRTDRGLGPGRCSLGSPGGPGQLLRGQV